MTLFKQTVLLFAAMLLLVLAIVLYSGFEESREYIDDELFSKAQNSASALSVAMSQSGADITKMSVIASAAFDTGYYKRVALISMRGEPLFVKEAEREHGGAPKWFKEAVGLSSAKAVAQVSDGWKPLGILEVVPDRSLAYEYLYTLFKKTVAIFLASIAVGIVLIIFGLKVLMRPIESMYRQAEEVLKNSFTINKEIPKSIELKRVTEAVNALVLKMKRMHEKLLDITAKNRDLEYKDSLTGLCNRRMFIFKYSEYSASEGGGSVVLYRLCGVEEANALFGFDRVDNLFKSVAEAVESESKKIAKDSLVCRVSGTEIAVLFPAQKADNTLVFAKEVMDKAKERIDSFGDLKKDLYLAGALCEFGMNKSYSRVFATLDLAIKSAQKRRFFIQKARYDEALLPLRKDEWRSLLLNKIEKEGLFLSLQDIVDSTQKVFASRALFEVSDKDGRVIKESMFMPMLSEVGLFESYAKARFKKIADIEGAAGGRIVVEFPFSYFDTTHCFEEAVAAILNIRQKGIEVVPQVWQGDLLRYEKEAISKVIDKLYSKSIVIAIKGFDADPLVLDLLKVIRPYLVTIEREYYEDMSSSLKESIYLLLQSVGCCLLLEGESSSSIDMKSGSKELLYLKEEERVL